MKVTITHNDVTHTSECKIATYTYIHNCLPNLFTYSVASSNVLYVYSIVHNKK